MAENPFGQFPQQQKPPQPGGAPIAPPPSPEIKIRSMASDTKSISEGASSPIPESITMPSENEPVFRPETQNRMPAPSMNFGKTPSPAPSSNQIEEEPVPKKKKGVLMFIIGLVIVVGLGLLGYFVIYPLVLGGKEATIVTTPPPPPPPPQVIPHQSLFLSAPDEKIEVLLDSVNLVTIANSLQALDLGVVTDPVFQEVVILDSAKSQIPWSDYLSKLLPEFTKEEVAFSFTDDFTAWVYHDARGRWPGYAVQIKNTDASSLIKKFETSNLSPLFLTPAGSLEEFKDGSLSGKLVRYSLGSAPGAAFEYGIVRDDILIISTSYDGLKEAARLLGI